jgi:CRP-like cAMP-binding protein
MGQAFGELALLHNKDRAATIQTRENTLLAVLEKADFIRILHKIEDKRLRSKAEFLRSLRAFAEWSELRMERLVYFFQEMTCSKGQIVYRKGDPPDNVYVTVSGEFQFRQDLTGLKSAWLLRKNESVLTVIGAKELFGEREALSGQKRQNTCVCSSQTASLYFIPKEDFIRFYQKESTQTCIQRVIDEKERWLHQRKSQLLKAEEVINAVNVQTSPEAKGTFKHSSASLSLKRDLQKFSNMILLKEPIPVVAAGDGSARGQKTSMSVGETSIPSLYSPRKGGKELLLPSPRLSKTRKSVSYAHLQLLNSRRFSSIIH